MSFVQYRPSSHFIPPHSWSNDPCGAVYIPETKEYLFCYQWNPGTSESGNCAWGMAKSKDLITWEDCLPALKNGDSYDRFGVFSGSIVSRLIEGRRVLFLFYTSVSAVPIHWSVDYIKGCESQSVAFSTDFGTSWHRYDNNPLMTQPPKGNLTTGWRDPFVSRWEALSTLLGKDASTDYMMLASGERGKGPQLHLYQSQNLLDWVPLSTLLSVDAKSKVSPTSSLTFGMNFECASFFSIGQRHYLIVGVEEDSSSSRHDRHYLLWMSGDLVLEHGKPKFVITSHGLLDHGISYAAHIFRDADGRLLQLAWAGEAAKAEFISKQGWAGCLPHPKEINEALKPIDKSLQDLDMWNVDESSGMMSTLSMRPAPQVEGLRNNARKYSLDEFSSIRSKNFEIEAKFITPSKQDIFIFNVRECPQSAEGTAIIFDMQKGAIMVNRNRSSLKNLGTTWNDCGSFELFPGEDLNVRIFVDNSIIEVFANDRFTLTSRIYPTFDTSQGMSFDFGSFDESFVSFQCWESLIDAWPKRKIDVSIKELIPGGTKEKTAMKVTESLMKDGVLT